MFESFSQELLFRSEEGTETNYVHERAEAHAENDAQVAPYQLVFFYPQTVWLCGEGGREGQQQQSQNLHLSGCKKRSIALLPGRRLLHPICGNQLWCTRYFFLERRVSLLQGSRLHSDPPQRLGKGDE